MASDKRSGEVARSLSAAGWLYRNDPIDYSPAAGSGGGADKLALKDGMGLAIEIKNGYSHFKFNDWRPNQREWAEWCEEDRGVPYYIWLLLGKDQPHWNEDKFNPRKSWLIPRLEFLRIEALVQPIQNTLVFRAGKGMNKKIQEEKLDAINLLADFELEWDKGVWIL